MGTETRYAQRVPRGAWNPDEEQKRLLAALKRAYKKADETQAEARRLLNECHHQAGIPVARLAEELELERKTVYRHLGRSMT